MLALVVDVVVILFPFPTVEFVHPTQCVAFVLELPRLVGVRVLARACLIIHPIIAVPPKGVVNSARPASYVAVLEVSQPQAVPIIIVLFAQSPQHHIQSAIAKSLNYIASISILADIDELCHRIVFAEVNTMTLAE